MGLVQVKDTMTQIALEPQRPSVPPTRSSSGARARAVWDVMKKAAPTKLVTSTAQARESNGLQAPSPLTAFLLDFSPVDWILTGFFAILAGAVLLGSGPRRAESMALVAADWVVLMTGLALSRGGILEKGRFVSTLVYRLTVFGTIVSSYFELRVILPEVRTRAVDASLFALDMRLFHVEPSLAWDRFVTPQTTEWFAFFYFGYFFLLAIHTIPFALFVKNTDVIGRFALGIAIVFCIGHLTYMLVPGYGPYAYLTNDFHHELSGGTFWGLVQEAVAAGGAQKDIFPSLHTAVPTFFALFSFRYRREIPAFRFSWPVVAFSATQIICATMFLRWHYLIDILAGISLAVAADTLSAKLVPWDDRRRAARGLAPAWWPMSVPWSWRPRPTPAPARSKR